LVAGTKNVSGGRLLLPQKKAAFFVRAGLSRSRQMPLGVSARLRAYISWASGQQHLDQRLSPGPAGLPGREGERPQAPED